MSALSQLTTSRPLPLSFDPSFMKDAECAEYNENIINIFSDFFFSSFSEKFIENCGADVTKMTITQKTKMEKS